MKNRGALSLPAGNTIRFGIIGTGEIVRMVVSTLNVYSGLKVIAIAGTNTSAARLLAKQFGGAVVYSEYKDLLNIKEVDAVYIATPPHLHAEMIKAAMDAGKHVVCEKPLVMNVEELDEILAAHKRHAALKAASCSSRFNICPPVRKAKELIAQGRLGAIQRVRLNNAIPLPIPLESLPAWKRSRKTSGGGLCMDWGVYDLDWLQFLLGEIFDPIALIGSLDHFGYEGTDLETGYTSIILCLSGLTVSLERRPEYGPHFQRAEIRGESGGLDLPFMPGGDLAHLTMYSSSRADKTMLHKEALPEQMNDWGTILAYPIIDLAQAIAEKREVASPLAAQKKIYQVIAALYKSSASGKSVKIE